MDRGTLAENAGFGSEIRALHAFLHLIYLPGQLPYKDPLELRWGEGVVVRGWCVETFPWELKVRKLNAGDKGSVEVKGIQHLPPAPTPGKWVISLLRYVRHSEPLVLPRAS